MKKVAIVPMLTILFTCTHAVAQGLTWDKQYVSVGASYGLTNYNYQFLVIDRADSHETTEQIADSGIDFFGFDVAYGANFYNNFRAEISAGYKTFDQEHYTATNIASDALIETYNSWMLNATLNAYYDFDFGYDVKPYLGAGLGLFMLELHMNMYMTEYETFEKNGFMGNLMAGLTYEVSDKLSFDLGYRYSNLFMKDIRNYLYTSPFHVGYRTADMSGIHELKISARYTF